MPVQKKKLSLKPLLTKVNKQNIQGELDFGPTVGRECWSIDLRGRACRSSEESRLASPESQVHLQTAAENDD